MPPPEDDLRNPTIHPFFSLLKRVKTKMALISTGVQQSEQWPTGVLSPQAQSWTIASTSSPLVLTTGIGALKTIYTVQCSLIFNWILVIPTVAVTASSETDYHSCLGILSPLAGEVRELQGWPKSYAKSAEWETLKRKKWQGCRPSEVGRGWKDSALERTSTSFRIILQKWIKTETTWLSLGNMHTAHSSEYSPGPHLTRRKRQSPRAYKSQQFPKSVLISLHLNSTGKLPAFMWQGRGRGETYENWKKQNTAAFAFFLLCPLRLSQVCSWHSVILNIHLWSWGCLALINHGTHVAHPPHPLTHTCPSSIIRSVGKCSGYL